MHIICYIYICVTFGIEVFFLSTGKYNFLALEILIIGCIGFIASFLKREAGDTPEPDAASGIQGGPWWIPWWIMVVSRLGGVKV